MLPLPKLPDDINKTEINTLLTSMSDLLDLAVDHVNLERAHAAHFLRDIVDRWRLEVRCDAQRGVVLAEGVQNLQPVMAGA